MSIITKIESQKNKSRVNIFVDDSFFCGLNKETAILFGLKEGKDVDEKKLESVIFESEVKSAFEKALDFVGRRMNTRKELFDKLTKKGYSGQVALNAIQKLEDYHYIDDELFAKQFLNANKNLSKRILKLKLAQKGISNDIVQDVTGNRTNEEELELCLAQAKKYLKTKKIDGLKELQKMQASLARKGFDYDIVKKACKMATQMDEDDF